MKVAEILNYRIHRIYAQFASIDDAYQVYPRTLNLVEVPDWTMPGYGYDPTAKGDERIIRPELSEGWEYDEYGNPCNIEGQREAEREQLHRFTKDDTMEALRKLREGDTTIDWQAWLDQLDAYNVAIEETQNQEGYPQKVVYPEYPTKPAGAS